MTPFLRIAGFAGAATVADAVNLSANQGRQLLSSESDVSSANDGTPDAGTAAPLSAIQIPSSDSDFIPVDPSSRASARRFDGIGATSAGASSRLLKDYPAKQKSEIYDLLFKPKFGAGLQMIKVEIGGDSVSSCGVEPSHMHSENEEPNFERGYEWEILVEAKKRNPNIKIAGLPWAFPGWVSGSGTSSSGDGTSGDVDIVLSQDDVESDWDPINDHSKSPQNQAKRDPFRKPELTIEYILTWMLGARDKYEIFVDYIGIWNERGSSAE
jgi:galactosylceramidase